MPDFDLRNRAGTGAAGRVLPSIRGQLGQSCGRPAGCHDHIHRAARALTHNARADVEPLVKKVRSECAATPDLNLIKQEKQGRPKPEARRRPLARSLRLLPPLFAGKPNR